MKVARPPCAAATTMSSPGSPGTAPVLLLQNEVPAEVNLAAAAAARRAGATVVLNAAPARQVSPELLALVDVLVVNRVEAAFLSDRPMDDRVAALAVVSGLDPRLPGLVVTLGGDGLVVRARGSEAIPLQAHPVKAISALGAGDCFVGAIASRLAAGAELVAACRWANAAAALYVSSDDAAQARLGPVDVEAFLARQLP